MSHFSTKTKVGQVLVLDYNKKEILTFIVL